jgi:Bifunctional DNA primase/polymerase, N-terminal
VRKAGAKGETLFYFGPGIEKSMSWNIANKRVVDLIGPGRQTVLPPSIHPDTQAPYRWLGLDTLEDLAPDELPELSSDIIEKISAALRPFGYEPDAEPQERGGRSGGEAETPFRALNEAALADLDAWVPALALCRCRRGRRGGYEAVPGRARPDTTSERLPGRSMACRRMARSANTQRGL